MKYARPPLITIAIGEGVYTMMVSQIPTDSLNLDEKPTCEYCHKFLKVIGETYERGKTRDKCTLRLACRRCSHLFLYNYHIEREETDNGRAS